MPERAGVRFDLLAARATGACVAGTSVLTPPMPADDNDEGRCCCLRFVLLSAHWRSLVIVRPLLVSGSNTHLGHVKLNQECERTLSRVFSHLSSLRR